MCLAADAALPTQAAAADAHGCRCPSVPQCPCDFYQCALCAMQMLLKRHQPHPPAAAAPPVPTIHDLPDACLVHCLGFLPQEER